MFAPTTAIAAEALDPTFGAGGITRLHDGYSGNPVLRTLGVGKDGYYVVGSGRGLDEPFPYGYHLWVRRILRDGSVDVAFGDKGLFVWKSPLPQKTVMPAGIVVDERGGIFIAGSVYYGERERANPFIIKLTRTGTLDRTFGTDGVVRFGFGEFQFSDVDALGIDAAARLYVAGQARPDALPQNARAVVMRFLSDGRSDLGYGQQGTAVLPRVSALDPSGSRLASWVAAKASPDHRADLWSSKGVQGLAVSKQGEVVAVGTITSNKHYYCSVARLYSNGQPERGFGQGGVLLIAPIPRQDSPCYAVSAWVNGTIVVGGKTSPQDASASHGDRAAVFGVTSSGQLDRSFGVGGVFHPIADRASSVRAVVQTRQGELFVSGWTAAPKLPHMDAFIFKSGATGKPDVNWPSKPAAIPGLMTIDLPIDGTSSNDDAIGLALDGESVAVGITTLRRNLGFPPSVARIHVR